MGYLHGVRQTRTESASLGLSDIDAGVIALVGTSAVGEVNKATLVLSREEAVIKFGTDVGGLTIGSALQTIYDNIPNAKVVVLNVLTEAKRLEVLASGKVKKVAGDYCTQIHKDAISNATGIVNLTSEVVAGIELLETAEGVVGVKPDVLIAPGYSQIQSVSVKLIATAKNIKALSVTDIYASDRATALTKRTEVYNSNDPRALYCFPNFNRVNSSENENQIIAYSVLVSVALSARQGNDAYGYTPSSFEFTGVMNPIVNITCSMSNESADSSFLNAKGIITYYKDSILNARVWGNWTGAYPADVKAENMITALRTWDVLDRLIASLVAGFVDKQITSGGIEFIKQGCQNKINFLIGKGSIIVGNTELDKVKTTAESIASGKLYFKHTLTFATSLDAVEFESVADISGYKTIL